MRYLSLFSGIEAASVAWVPLGWEPVAFCEVEPFPCAVLDARFPGVPNLGDVADVDWGEWVGGDRRPDVIVGGSPCQSFSVAGLREGLAGASGLMWEYVRAIRDVRPRWLVWENVPGALSSSRGEDFRCLLRELDVLGYGLAWRVLDAQFFGVAQRRRRVFLVGRLGDPRGPAQVLLEPHCLRWDTPSSRAKREELAARAGCRAEGAGRETPIGFSWHNGGSTNLSVGDTSPCIGSHMQPAVAIAQNQRAELRVDGGDGQTMGAIPATRSGKQLQAVICRASGQAHAETCEDMAPTLSARQHRDPPIVGDGMVVRRIMPVEAERLQGLPDGWTDVPWRGRDHAPDTPRYKAIGNSMAVPVMEWIGRRMAAYGLLEGELQCDHR